MSKFIFKTLGSFGKLYNEQHETRGNMCMVEQRDRTGYVWTYIVLGRRQFIISIVMKKATSISCLDIIAGMVADENILYGWSSSARFKIQVNTKWIPLFSLMHVKETISSCKGKEWAIQDKWFQKECICCH